MRVIGNGGFAFADLGAYGAFTSGTAKTSQDVSQLFPIVNQTKKLVIVSGLTVGTTEYPPFAALFKSATASSVTTCTSVVSFAGKNLTVAITSAGSITVTQAT